MKKPFVISINANGGGGKTSLTRLLHASLPSSVLLGFDDFGEPSVEPVNCYDWLLRGADILEFDCPIYAKAVGEALERRTMDYLILDYPFGREHPRLRDVIVMSVYIDTPLDVAFARRLLRDYEAGNSAPAARRLQELRRHAMNYLESDRELFIHHHELHKSKSDLILDGLLSLEELRDQLLAHIEKARQARACNTLAT